MEIVSDGPTLVLSGDFDVRSTWEVRNALRERLHGHEQDLVVDLTDVRTMDLTAARVSSPTPAARPAVRATTSRSAAAAPPSAGCCTSRT